MLLENMNTIQCSTSGPQPHLFETRPPVQGWTFPARRRAEAPRDESTIVASFATWVNSLGPLSQASPALQARILSKVEALARHIDGSVEAGAPSGYDRRVLYEDPERWSIAAVILRAGQHTERHDHGGWGCAVTVQGIERNRRFASDASGALVLSDERDYPPGTGYVFDAVEVHEPLGADQQRVTVALHFLVHEGHAEAHAEASVHELKAA